MRSGNAWLLVAAVAMTAACGGGSSGSGSGGGAPNTLPLSVDGALCSASSYPNKPCVKATICTPGTSTCQEVSDLLLDTGSTGLRIFKQALTVSLPNVASGGGTLATCIQYGDGSSQWGPVAKADVVLAGEPAVNVPVEVIDSTFASVPVRCGTPDTAPAQAGYNGILGIGFFVQDCGPACATRSDNGIYFSCTGSSCPGAAVPLASQVQNPAALLPGDGNGLVLDLPAVATTGARSVEGTLTLGIGTQADNTPSGVAVYLVDDVGQFTTSFEGATGPAFVDTGSNGLFFTPGTTSLPSCPSPDAEWFCPPSTVHLTATNSGAGGGTAHPVSFDIANFESVINTSNQVFPSIGGSALPSFGFDWGLPFHLGRKVYVGFEGRVSPLGTGPYVAY